MQKNILVVDDEKNIRTTVGYCLDTLGYKYDMAVNGEEALTILKNNSYDLILLDIKMPGITGMELLSKIRANNNQTNVIMMTAYGTIKDAVTAMKLQAIDFIGKPFTVDQLEKILSNVFLRERLTENNIDSFEEKLEFIKLCITKQNYSKAIEILKLALSTNTESPIIYNLLGVLAEYQGDVLLAHKYYLVALNFDPSYSPAQNNIERLTNFDYIKPNIK